MFPKQTRGHIKGTDCAQLMSVCPTVANRVPGPGSLFVEYILEVAMHFQSSSMTSMLLHTILIPKVLGTQACQSSSQSCYWQLPQFLSLQSIFYDTWESAWSLLIKAHFNTFVSLRFVDSLRNIIQLP